jgi:hypothetical protein
MKVRLFVLSILRLYCGRLTARVSFEADEIAEKQGRKGERNELCKSKINLIMHRFNHL